MHFLKNEFKEKNGTLEEKYNHIPNRLYFVTPLTVAHQAPLSMEFSRQEGWTGLLFPSRRGSS